jgi:cytochrome oxidase assembly protein ShyY1
MTAPILIIAGLLATAALAIWQVRRPPWESKRLRRQVERDARRMGVISPETRKRALGREGEGGG